MTDNELEWFDEFWETLYFNEDDALSALRLIGEMFVAGLLWRDGDDLVGRAGDRLTLIAKDQYLVRRIEDAANNATREVFDDESS